jgi:hypothetical protein
MHDIGCVLITNMDDVIFLKSSLKQICPIVNEVVIAIGNKLWNGEDEDPTKYDIFTGIVKQFDNVHVIKYSISDDKIKCVQNIVSPEMYWEGHARWVALENMKYNHDYILYLDSDEIVDGVKFATWLDTKEYQNYACMKLKNYWYWREPTFQAKDYYEDSVVLAKLDTYNPLYIFSNLGRHGVFDSAKGTKARMVTGVDGKPFVHHFSWVRTKEQMERKVRSWGHRNDKNNWVELVNEEFSRNFNGTDFLKGLSYNNVDNIFSIKTQKSTLSDTL